MIEHAARDQAWKGEVDKEKLFGSRIVHEMAALAEVEAHRTEVPGIAVAEREEDSMALA